MLRDIALKGDLLGKENGKIWGRIIKHMTKMSWWLVCLKAIHPKKVIRDFKESKQITPKHKT
jgi:hypothetical protein